MNTILLDFIRHIYYTLHRQLLLFLISLLSQDIIPRLCLIAIRGQRYKKNMTFATKTRIMVFEAISVK